MKIPSFEKFIDFLAGSINRGGIPQKSLRLTIDETYLENSDRMKEKEICIHTEVNDIIPIIGTIKVKNVKHCKMWISYDREFLRLETNFPSSINFQGGTYTKKISWELKSIKPTEEPSIVSITAEADQLLQKGDIAIQIHS